MLCGHPLYTGNDALDICLKQLSEVPPLPSSRLKKTISEDLEQLVMQCLQKDPSKRPVSAEQLEGNLSHCQNTIDWSFLLAAKWWAEMASSEKGASASGPVSDATVIVGNESTLM